MYHRIGFFFNGSGLKSKNQWWIFAHAVFLFKFSHDRKIITASQLPVLSTCDLLQFPEAAQLLQAQPRRVGRRVPEKLNVQISYCARGEKHQPVLYWSPPPVDIKFFIRKMLAKNETNGSMICFMSAAVGHVAMVRFEQIFFNDYLILWTNGKQCKQVRKQTFCITL